MPHLIFLCFFLKYLDKDFQKEYTCINNIIQRRKTYVRQSDEIYY